MTTKIPFEGYGSKEFKLTIDGYTYTFKPTPRQVTAFLKATVSSDLDKQYDVIYDMLKSSIPQENLQDFKVYLSIHLAKFISELLVTLELTTEDKVQEAIKKNT